MFFSPPSRLGRASPNPKTYSVMGQGSSQAGNRLVGARASVASSLGDSGPTGPLCRVHLSLSLLLCTVSILTALLPRVDRAGLDPATSQACRSLAGRLARACAPREFCTRACPEPLLAQAHGFWAYNCPSPCLTHASPKPIFAFDLGALLRSALFI